MDTSRKDRNSNVDFMTQQDIFYTQTYYNRESHCICKTVRSEFTT